MINPTKTLNSLVSYIALFFVLSLMAEPLNSKTPVKNNDSMEVFQPFELPVIGASKANWQSSASVGRVVYLDFWASWCEPCRYSFPVMNLWQRNFSARGLDVVAISVDREYANAQQFSDEYGAEFTVLWDQDQTIAKRFAIKGMPSSVLIDRQGRVRYHHSGFRHSDQEKLTQMIEVLLNEQL